MIAGATVGIPLKTVGLSGGPVDADEMPSGVVYRNGTATSVAVFVERVDIGSYKLSFTVPESWAAGELLAFERIAMVNGLTLRDLMQLGAVMAASQSIVTDIERSGGKLDRAMRAAQAAEDNTA